MLRFLLVAAATVAVGPRRLAPADPAPVPRQALTLKQLPLELRPPARGRLAEAWRWTDRRGENTLVVWQQLTQTRPREPEAQIEPQRSAQLFARQSVRQYGRYEALWKLQDGVFACEFDASAAPVPGATAVTDLDGDGQTETTLMYSLSCRSDVSPEDLKLIMYDGPAKYALRGFTVVPTDARPAAQRRPTQPCCLDQLTPAQREQAYERNEHMGRYRTEDDFRLKPKLLAFARQHWLKYCVPAGN